MTTTTMPGPERRWWPDGARAVLAATLTVIGLVGLAVVLGVMGDHHKPAPVTATPTDSQYAQAFCEGVAHFYAIKGTDCRSLPIVTAPGALGPANTGGPAGGTDWEPAYPGSNVWIPDYQISGRLFVLLPGSREKPPAGYENLGKTPDGATLYWRPSDHPTTESPLEKK